MNNNIVKNNSKDISIQSDPFENSLKSLEFEASVCFDLLDKTSAKIKRLENILGSFRFNFPFRYIVYKEKESGWRLLQDYHKIEFSDFHYFTTREIVCLAWEPVENNGNKYRLFLVIEEKEILLYDDGDGCSRREFQSRDIYKKPFIEVDSQKRMKYAGFMDLFIKEFEENIKKIRKSLSSFVKYEYSGEDELSL